MPDACAIGRPASDGGQIGGLTHRNRGDGAKERSPGPNDAQLRITAHNGPRNGPHRKVTAAAKRGTRGASRVSACNQGLTRLAPHVPLFADIGTNAPLTG